MNENYIYLDGKKIEISNETAENLRKEVGEYQFEHGDIAKTGWGTKRVIIGRDKLTSYDRDGFEQSTGQEDFVKNDYKKIGNVFED